MEFFRDANFDFLGKKWFFLALTAILIVAGLWSIFFWHGIPLGVDFKGGTLVYVKFSHAPDADKMRSEMTNAGLANARIQRYGAVSNNEVIIALEQQGTSDEALDQGKLTILRALSTGAPEGKRDLNNTSQQTLQEILLARDPLSAGTDAAQRYTDAARAITQYRDLQRGGVLTSFDELKGQAEAPVLAALQRDFYISDFNVRNVEIVGAQVGEQLQKQALMAVGFSMLGMLVYLWFRFEMIYGVASIVAIVHDVMITLGAFSLTNREISLTVIAALLTLVGYSMNDTIVIFDRIRENVKLMRRVPFAELVNRSINQTLGRTVLTTGLTFATVLSLFIFGGEVLDAFAFTLVVGILVGTYSSFAVAAPLVVWYQEWKAAKEGRGAVVAGSRAGEREKIRAKA
ncbi:MAG: protein translocase subunit SecF [Acidobacteria bacterium]|nr:protein translocase subunit SecF [Acidobacteriota bacterium]